MTSLQLKLDSLEQADWLGIISATMQLGGLTEINLTEELMSELLANRQFQFMSIVRLPTGGLQFKFVTQAEADFINAAPSSPLEIN
jgi:hypothetical protein